MVPSFASRKLFLALIVVIMVMDIKSHMSFYHKEASAPSSFMIAPSEQL